MDTNPCPDLHAHGYSYSHFHAYGYPLPYFYTYGYPKADPHADQHPNGGNADGDTNRSTISDFNVHSNGDTDRSPLSNGYSSLHTDNISGQYTVVPWRFPE